MSVLQHGVGRSSGVATDARYFFLWTFRGGKVIRIETFVERGDVAVQRRVALTLTPG